MACNVLAVPATSVDVERMFSMGRNVVTQHQHRLNKGTMADKMFYHGACSRIRQERQD